jgi:hypothetical protein
MTRWDRFDLDLPPDFPVATVDSLHAYLSDRDPNSPRATEWKEWSTGLNGLVYRFLACHEDGEAAVASLRASNAPPQPERYRQERDLFRFYFEGLSALECIAYAVYFLGSLADPAEFPTSVDRKRLEPRYVSARYSAHSTFRAERIAIALHALTASGDFEEWGKIRNFLGHRGAASRTIYAKVGTRKGGARADWNLPIAQVDVSALLEPSELERRREWLGSQVREVCEAAHDFALAHIP